MHLSGEDLDLSAHSHAFLEARLYLPFRQRKASVSIKLCQNLQ